MIDTEENKGVGDYIKIVKLLNQQDIELSKLRASYQQVKEENKQLKQQLHDLPKKIVEEIKIELYSKARSITGTGVNCVRLYDIQKILDTILKEYQK